MSNIIKRQQDFISISFSTAEQRDVELKKRTIDHCNKNGLNRSSWLKLLIAKALKEVENRP